MDTKKYLMALEDVLSQRYPKSLFCIGGYQEAAVCVQSNHTGWIVYNGERGNKYDEIFCDTVLEACLEMIRKMTHRVEDISSMENELIKAVQDNESQ